MATDEEIRIKARAFIDELIQTALIEVKRKNDFDSGRNFKRSESSLEIKDQQQWYKRLRSQLCTCVKPRAR